MHALSLLGFFILALCAHASITQKDYTGSGNILVLNSSDWRTASPTKDRVGCLNEHGKLIPARTKSACGTFTRSDAFPYTLSTKKGNCTFNDESQERNTDSKYGAGDFAWNCNATYVSSIYDQLYTIVSSGPPEKKSLSNASTGRLPTRLPLLRRHSMLLRRQEGAWPQREAVALAVPLGIAADGDHAGARAVAVAVGEDWICAEEESRWGSAGAEGEDHGRGADSVVGGAAEGRLDGGGLYCVYAVYPNSALCRISGVMHTVLCNKPYASVHKASIQQKLCHLVAS